MKVENSENSCVAQPFPKNTDLKKWIESLGGKVRVSGILEVDESTLWRYETGNLETPKWLRVMMDMSARNAKLSQELNEIKKKKGVN